MSVSGALVTAVKQSQMVGATAVQIFTKSQLRWQASPIAADAATEFREAVAAAALRFVCVHNSYLINLAATADELREKSVASLIHELERAELLGCACLVMHPGSPRQDGADVGIQRVVAGLRAALKATAGFKVRIALENTAGQGATLGVKMQELGAMIAGVDGDPRVGVCIDTCHAFAAGYELRTPQAVAALVDEIAKEIGLERVIMLHLNDCKKECGSRIDRHEHIGQGCIGEAAFGYVLQEPRLAGIPGIIETPKDEAKDPELTDDKRNLALLRSLEG
jgi:deoxyribonuclease-4